MGTDAELKLDWMQQTLISLVSLRQPLFLRKPGQALSHTDGSPLNNAMHVTPTPTPNLRVSKPMAPIPPDADSSDDDDQPSTSPPSEPIVKVDTPPVVPSPNPNP